MPTTALAPDLATKPRRRGRPTTPEAEIVRRNAAAILETNARVAEIAHQYGVSRRTVYRWLQQAHA